MKFRNYCIVVMGEMKTVKDHIIKVAESKPRYIDAKGILIATFASVATPAELEDFFIFEGRSFFLFDLDKDKSGFNMDNEKLHKHLFGYLFNQESELKEMSERLMDDISATTKNSKSMTIDDIPEDIRREMAKPIKSKAKAKVKLTPKIHINDMTKKERESIINRILDKGFDKLTNSDKDILKKISELK